MADKTKILMVSHGHPDHSVGGGEIAAYNLHNALNIRDGFESVFFARHGKPELIHGGTPFAGTGRPGEVLFYATMPDWFRFSQPDKAAVWRDFREMLRVHRPDIVHFHHYFQLGLELFREVRNFDPTIKIVLTLHEYMAICNNEGQMIKPDTGALCYESSPSECARCFKKRNPQDFFLREQFIKSHFEVVDQFIAPSEFLKQRYVQWGIAASRIKVVENLLPGSDESRDRPPAMTDKVRLAYFGQINRFKGLDLLIKAMLQLPPEVQRRVQLDINGSGLEHQTTQFQKIVNSGLKQLGDSARLRGRYTPRELGRLLAGTDWMIVPSQWWENSPVVIMEAKRHGVPVICSDIGGMAEKVEHGRTGRHFLACRENALADAITWAVDNRDQQPDYAKAIAADFPGDAPLDAHINLYESLQSVVATSSAMSNDKVEPLRVAS